MANAAEMRIGLGVSPRHPGVAPTVLSMLQSARRGLAEAAAPCRTREFDGLAAPSKVESTRQAW